MVNNQFYGWGKRVAGGGGGGGGGLDLPAFASFSGVNTLTRANYKLPIWSY